MTKSCVGEVVEVPGTNSGFTMVTFNAQDVPVGTKLYTSGESDRTESDYMVKEALAYLETLAEFGGTIQQARELARKGVQKLKEMNNV